EDSQRCKGMLRDLCGSSKREIAGLVAAIEEKIPAELMKPHPILVSLRANMIIRLEDNRGLAPDLAVWTVDTWGLVLGTWTQADLDSFSPIAPSPSPTPPSPTPSPPQPSPPVGTGTLSFDLPNNGGKLELIAVPSGTLVMEGGYWVLKKEHRVQLPAFHIGKYPVTQRQYQAVMNENPSGFSGQNNPVDRVTWHDAQAFCTKLTQILKRQGGYEVSLPSETMWEWAARGATRSKGYTYAGSNNPDEVGWYYDNSGSETHPVGQKKPNELGIYDMSGNVWEWCQDNWTDNVNVLPQNGTALTQGGNSDRRAVRGGGWGNLPKYCRCSQRSRDVPTGGGYGNPGFRVWVGASAL
ncbi:MAG: formylglycine-generating enzyme family protein, partial [Prochlorotrichaceae cyanobacterium]